MDNNNIRSSSPSPSITTTDSGIVADQSEKGSAFSRTASPVTPELNQQDLKPAATQETNIRDRASSGLTAGQKVKLGLLWLGAALLSGIRANHWLANKALQLFQDAKDNHQDAVAKKLQDIIGSQPFRLDEKQSHVFEGMCQSFADRDMLVDLSDNTPSPSSDSSGWLESRPTEKDKYESIAELDRAFASTPSRAENESSGSLTSNPSFTERMTALYEEDKSHEALAEMEKKLFDGTSHEAKESTIKMTAEIEETPASNIAGIFNHVVYGVVTGEATTPISKERLEQLKVMTQSMKKLYPLAGNYDRTLSNIDQQMDIK